MRPVHMEYGPGAVGVVSKSDELTRSLQENTEYIQQETLTQRLLLEPNNEVDGIQHSISEHNLVLYVKVVK